MIVLNRARATASRPKLFYFITFWSGLGISQFSPFTERGKSIMHRIVTEMEDNTGK